MGAILWIQWLKRCCGWTLCDRILPLLWRNCAHSFIYSFSCRQEYTACITKCQLAISKWTKVKTRTTLSMFFTFFLTWHFKKRKKSRFFDFEKVKTYFRTMDRTYCALQLLSYCFCFFLLYFCFWLSALLISQIFSPCQTISFCVVKTEKITKYDRIGALARSGWHANDDNPPQFTRPLYSTESVCPADHTDVRRGVIAIEMQFVVHRVGRPTPSYTDVPLICSLTLSVVYFTFAQYVEN